MAGANVLHKKVDVLDVKPGYRLLLLARCLVGTVNMFGLFSSIKYISSSQASLITNMSPLLVGIMAHYILKETIYKSTVVALAGSFIGVTLFSFHNSESVSSNDGFIIGISLAFTACCCSAAVVIIVRKLIQEVHYTLTPFYNSVTMLAVAIILLAFYPSVYNFRYYRLVDIVLFMISGIFNYLALLTKTIASKYGSASFVAPFNYLQVVLLLICDLALFGYTFALIDYAGVILTFSCVLLPVYQKLANSNKTTPKN